MLTPVFHNPALPAPEMTIINAALNLLLRTSPQQMTMTQVYKAAGVSKATCYQYFSSKADLWCALFVEEERLHHAALERLPSKPGIQDWQQLFQQSLQFPNKLAAFLALADCLSEQTSGLRRYQQWQVLRQQNRRLVMTALLNDRSDVEAMGEAERRLAIIWCTLEGWLGRYRDSIFLRMSGERRRFARELALHCARLAANDSNLGNADTPLGEPE